MKTLVLGEPKLSDREKRIFSLFWRKGFEVDIPIDKMYEKYVKCEVEEYKRTQVTRRRQMAIGMAVTRINRKLKGTKIVPGALKRTYRLIMLGE